MMQTEAASELGADLAIINRQVSAGTITSEKMQIFVNAGTDDEPDFYPVKGKKIHVIDMDKIERISVVKFRRKTP